MKPVSFYQSPRIKPTPFTKPQQCNQGTRSNISKSFPFSISSGSVRNCCLSGNLQPTTFRYHCSGEFVTHWKASLFSGPLLFKYLILLLQRTSIKVSSKIRDYKEPTYDSTYNQFVSQQFLPCTLKVICTNLCSPVPEHETQLHIDLPAPFVPSAGCYWP